MTDDHRLDEGIRSLLGMAGADAPTDTVPVHAIVTRHARSRVLVVAAAVVLVLVGAVVLTSGRDGQPQVAPATTPVAVSSTVAQSSGDPTVPDGPLCTVPNITEYDEIGTMHTVMPNEQPLDAYVTVDSTGSFCSGDTIVVSVTVHNRGVATESVPTRLILNGGPNKYPVIEYPPYPLQPGNSRTETFEVTLPAAPPGNYVLGLYGLGEGAPITLANPPLCDETTLETTATADAAMGTHYAFITGTNVGTRDCFIGAVRRVENYVDGIPNLLSNVGGLDQPSLPPLQSHVLRPGDRVGIVVSTTSSCLDGTVVEQPIEVLALHMSMRGVTPVTVDLRGVGVQSACDFSLSDWGVAPQ